MEFFEIQNDMPVLRPAVRSIDAFRAIIVRDKNRNKHQAIKELAYIYFTHDYLSPYYNYGAEERETTLRENLKLAKSWKVDKILQRGLDVYKSLVETTSMKFLRETIETLHASAATLVLLREQLETSVRIIQLTPPVEIPIRESYPEGDTGRLEYGIQLEVVMKINSVRGDETQSAVKSVQELLSLSKNIPSAIGNLQDLEAKIKKELTQDSRVRGGGEIGDFENPGR